jgi:hypothetical protein
MPGTNETGLPRADNKIGALNGNGHTQAETLNTIQIEFSDLKDESPSVKNQEEYGNENTFTPMLKHHGVVVVIAESARREMKKGRR